MFHQARGHNALEMPSPSSLLLPHGSVAVAYDPQRAFGWLASEGLHFYKDVCEKLSEAAAAPASVPVRTVGSSVASGSTGSLSLSASLSMITS